MIPIMNPGRSEETDEDPWFLIPQLFLPQLHNLPADDGDWPSDHSDKSLETTSLVGDCANIENVNIEMNDGISGFGFSEQVVFNLLQMGIRRPTAIQTQIWNEIRTGSPKSFRILAQAWNGAGKTLAYLVPIFGILERAQQKSQALCLVPTVELAHQIADVAQCVGRNLIGISIYEMSGKWPPKNRGSKEILISTSGRIQEIMSKELIEWDMRSFFVRDEVDMMVTMPGHYEICFKVMEALPDQCSLLFVSATFTDYVIERVKCHVKYPDELKVFALDRKMSMNPETTHLEIPCASRDEKLEILRCIFERIVVSKCVIFCRTRQSAQFIKCDFEQQGVKDVGVLTGNNSVIERMAALNKFRECLWRVLITTNILSRGINLSGTNVVINYDIPTLNEQPDQVDYDTYLHRVGRAARINGTGLVINLSDHETGLTDQLHEYFGLNIVKTSVYELC
ncbi:hypothetical protein ACOME3_008176 [Neoechinorhynchus agilis]